MPDIAVDIATFYGVDGPEIESPRGWDVPRQSRMTLGTTRPPIQLVTGLLTGGKAAEAWRWPVTTI